MARTGPRLTPEIYDGAQLAKILPHSDYDEPQTMAIWGRRGMGKTFAETAYIEERESRLLVITPRPNDFLRVREAESLDQALEDLSHGEPCRRRVVVDRGELGELEGLEEYGDFMWGRFCTELRDVLLVVSEAHRFSLPPPKPPHRDLVDLVTQGRHWGVRMMADSQRPQFFQSVYLAEGTHLIIFKLVLPIDLDVVERWAGPEVRDTVAGLDKGKCVIVEL